MEKEVKSKKGKIIKRIIIGILIAIGIFFAVIMFLAFKYLQEEDILTQEIINYSNKNLLTDNFTIEVKTSGDYAYVEEAVKKYYKELSDNVKMINYFLNNEKISTVLLSSNLAKDRPDYKSSYNTVKESRTNINNAVKNINNLCKEETIKSLLDKEKLYDEEYYYDLYLNYMYTEQNQEEFEAIKEEATTLSSQINNFLDKVEEILNFLKDNDSIIEYENNQIYFKTDASYNKYKTLSEELQDIINEINASSGSNTY